MNISLLECSEILIGQNDEIAALRKLWEVVSRRRLRREPSQCGHDHRETIYAGVANPEGVVRGAYGRSG